MQRVDCSRCWFAKRRPESTSQSEEKQYQCAHPSRALVRMSPVRSLGPTGLVQLAACPKTA